MFKIKKLNSGGFGHHFLLPILVIALIAAAGSYVVMRSKASTSYTNGPIYTGNSFVRPDGSKEAPDFYAHAYSPVFSPNGSQVAWSTIDSGPNFDLNIPVLKVAKSDGTESKEIYRSAEQADAHGNWVRFGRPTWSSDGKYIAALHTNNYENIAYPESSSLMVLRADGNTAAEDFYREISLFPQSEGSPFIQSGVQFVPGTSKIAYIISSYNYEINPKLCTVDIVSATEPNCVDVTNIDKTIGNYPSYLRISNKGVALFQTSLARYGDDRGYDEQLYTLNLTTGKAAPLGGKKYVSMWRVSGLRIEWSPDGEYIAYQDHIQEVGNDQSRAGTFIMRADGGEVRRVSEHYNQLAWQPVPIGGQPSPLPNNMSFASCTFVNTPQTVAGQPLKLAVRFNTPAISPITVKPKFQQYIDTFKVTQLADVVVPVDGFVDITINTDKISYAVDKDQTARFTVLAERDGYSYQLCELSVPLPKPALSLDKSTYIIPYGKSGLAVTGKTAPNQYVSVFAATATKKWRAGQQLNTNNVRPNAQGIFSIPLPSIYEDFPIYAATHNKLVKSANSQLKVSPYVSGATSRTVKRNSTTTISGNYIPNTTIKLYMRKPSDPAGKYPTVANVKVNANGGFSYTFKANTKKSLYFSAPNGTKTPVYTVNVR